MSPGTLVHLTETANLSAGIDPSVDLFGIILEPVDYKSLAQLRQEDLVCHNDDVIMCYRVLLSNSDIEIFYIEDLEEVDEEDNSS
jgi:hypothetical protein